MKIVALLSLTLFLGCSGNGKVAESDPFDSTACPGKRVQRVTHGSGCRDASGETTLYVEKRCCD